MMDEDKILNELTEYDKRRENRLDKFINHIDNSIQSRPLNEEEEEYFELMHLAFHLSNKFFSPQQVIKHLQNPKKTNGKIYSKSMAYQIFKDSQNLFGNSEELNAIALKKTLTEFLFKSNKLVMECDKSTKLEKAAQITKNTLALKDLYGIGSEKENINPELLMPDNVNFVFEVQQANVLINNNG
jgi:hypothetical protein